jgi:AhpD family alkylhydroperoxidase
VGNSPILELLLPNNLAENLKGEIMKDHYYAKDGLASIGKFMELKPDIAAAHVTRCPYCIEIHTNKAKKMGASDEEIAEAVFAGIAMEGIEK